MVTNSSKTASGGKEYWLKNNWLPNPWLRVSTISESQDAPWQDPGPEESDKLIAILKERIRSNQCTLVSAVVDKPDFLPLSFLQTGAKRSLAVCRIVRNFSLQVFKELVKEIQNLKDTSNFDSIEKLKEIFSIPDCVADEIFNHKSPLPENGLIFLKALAQISEEQLAKLNPIPIGTGFLVGGTHLLTNQHVLPTQEVAEQCIAQFNYVDEVVGAQSIDYEFDPRVLFVSNPDLDYTVVQLKAGMFTMPAGYKFGWIQLIEDEDNIASELDKVQTEKLKDDGDFSYDQLKSQGLDKEGIIPGDAVIIIQHPKGRRKQITLTNNTVKGLYKDFLRYSADSDYGSSGSPVFNNKWELVALHHAAIAKKKEEEQDIFKVEVVAQQGVRIHRIIEDLKKKSNNPKLKSFIEDFIVTSEALNSPPLQFAFGLDGVNSYINLGADKSLVITKEMTFEVWLKRDSVLQDGLIVNQVGVYALSLEGGMICLRTKPNATSEVYAFFSPLCCEDELWHHVAFTVAFTGDDKPEVQLYIDGKNINFDLGAKYPDPDIEINYNNLGNLYIGGNPDKRNCFRDTTKKYFSGAITEVRLWRIIRNPQQIKDTMYRPLNSDDMKNLMGYWRFNESESYKVYNLAKSSISSSPSSSPSIFTSEPHFGLQLNDELSDYIDCGAYESLKIENAITIEAWVRQDVKKKDAVIVNRGGSWYEQGYCMWLFEDRIRVELTKEENKIPIVAIADTEPNVLTLNQWHHIATTWDQKSKMIKIYIDGRKQSSKQKIVRQDLGDKDAFAYSGDDKPFEGPIGQPRVNLNIGRAQKYGHYFNGRIAEVRIWKVARSEEQIKANMSPLLDSMETIIEKEKSEGLISYWRLDEEEGNKAKNFACEGNDGLIDGGEWLKPLDYWLANNQGAFGVTVKTKRLRAYQYPTLPLPFGLQFKEQSAHVDCGRENLSTPKAITIEAWFKHKFGNCLIVNRGGIVNQRGSVEKGYSLSWYNGKIRVDLIENSGERIIVYSKDDAPSDCVWHHIAFTWAQPSGEITIYIDGKRQDCIVEGKSRMILFQGQSKILGLFAGSIDNPEASLLIGCIIGQNKEQKTYYNVAIAEVRLWNIAQTQVQIKANMSLRLKGNEEGLIGYWRLDDGGEHNKQVRNFACNNNHGTVHGAKWFPASPSTP
ncbi:MAG TPA: LamG-like jellyroll fold domain-containing protein [Stenomitos sp.]